MPAPNAPLEDPQADRDTGPSATCVPPERFQPDRGASICLDCGLDDYSTSEPGATRCTCLAGAKRRGFLCELCPPGEYSATIDAPNCTTCQRGSYPTEDANDNDGAGVTFGARACVPCPRDTYSTEPKTALCSPCPLQRTSEPGSTVCGDCVERTYYDPTTAQCEDCVSHVTCTAGTTLATWDLDSGYWRKDVDIKEVHVCPGGMSSCEGGPGATGDAICTNHFTGRLCTLCSPGYFFTKVNGRCRKCTNRTSLMAFIFSAISIVAVCVVLLLLLSGEPILIIEIEKMRQQHKRTSTIVHTLGQQIRATLPVRRQSKNLGFFPPPIDVSHSRRATVPADSSSKSSIDRDEAPASSSIIPRPEEPADSTLKRNLRRPSVVEILRRPAVVLGGEDKEEKRLQQAQDSVELMQMYAMLSVKWKIVISSFQILFSNSQSFLIKWPKGIAFLFSFLSIFNIDVMILPQFQCFRKVNHYDRLLAATTAPLLLILITVFLVIKPLDDIAKSDRNKFLCGRYERQHSKLAVVLLVLFFAYSNASQTIAQTFVCQQFEDDAFLRVDLSIRCSGQTYCYWTWFAVIMMFIWPFGTPSLFFCLTWRYSSRINPMKLRKKDITVSPLQKERAVMKAVAQRQFDHTLYKTKVLWLPYEPEYWYWEAVVSGQRMLLTFVASLVKPGTPVQTVFCLGVAMIFLRLQNYFAPYLHDHDDILAEWFAWILIFFYIQALLFTLGNMSGTLFDVGLCISVGLALFGSFFVLIYDIKRELDFAVIFRKTVRDTLVTARQDPKKLLKAMSSPRGPHHVAPESFFPDDDDSSTSLAAPTASSSSEDDLREPSIIDDGDLPEIDLDLDDLIAARVTAASQDDASLSWWTFWGGRDDAPEAPPPPAASSNS